MKKNFIEKEQKECWRLEQIELEADLVFVPAEKYKKALDQPWRICEVI
ncbi:hypothetical protein [Blautia glucerasea]|nr:hypothetical protein [Blautia glucerasea]NSJ25741.1 hypothetical protein [Blautia glucerasea]